MMKQKAIDFYGRLTTERNKKVFIKVFCQK